MSTLPCPPEHWSRFSDLLDSAMDLPEPDRALWLQRLDGDDAVLRPWLARVLGSAASISTSDFLDSLRLPGAGDGGFAAGELIGPYRLEALLGEGGMGQVWRACRADDGPQREVALKLPYAELLAGPFRQRFRRERDMVAALSHPNIGALYDAGVSAEGHPYLALELIEGEPITTHCRAAATPLEQRIDLIRQVLAALGYAHSRLIVHRDIKPSNVMVTPAGQVKLLDFGIAKLLDGAPTGEAPLTQPAARLATPGYAAPEQMNGGAVTVAADLFSVGVLLFELCTGQRPPLLRGPESDAPPASSRAAASALPAFAAMARRLRGDLDAIIAKALAFDPSRRYASAEAFGRDLRRWQDGMPVSAHRIGWGSMAMKFVKRNKLGAGLTAVLALTLAGGTATVAWQARRAEHEAVRANAIKDFLIGLFGQSDPRTGKRSVDMTARQLLDAGADGADAAFAHDPATEIELMETFGNIYDALGDGPRAEAVWSRRLDLTKQVYGASDPRVVEAAMHVVSTEVEFQDEDKAKTLLEQIRAPVFKLFGAESLERAEWLTARTNSLRDTSGGRDEAIADAKAAIAIYEQHFRDSPSYVDTLIDLSDYYYDAEQYAASMATVEKARAVLVAQHSFDVMEQIMYGNGMAASLAGLGRFTQADAQLAQVQAQSERELGRQSLWYIHAVTARAQQASVAGDRQRAAAYFQSLASAGLMSENATNAASGLPTSARRAYGAALARDGLASQAIAVLQATLAATRLHKRDEANVRRTEQQLGDAYDQAGRTQEARALLQAARNEFVQFGNPGQPMTLNAEERWARFLLDHGEPAAAAGEFSAVLAQAHGTPGGAAAMASAGLARIALAAGDLAQADARSAAAMSLLATTTVGYDVRYRVDTALVRAQVLLALRRPNEALVMATQAAANARLWYAPGTKQIAHADEVVAQIAKK